MKFIDVKGKDLLYEFLNDCKMILGSSDEFLEQTKEYIKTNERFDYLTDLWYERLDSGDLEAAYGVYSDEYYLTDQFNCFRVYARHFLMMLRKPMKPIGKSCIEYTSDCSSIIDVGNGLGYSTIILSQEYSDRTVYGTNLKNTDQWKFSSEMGNRYGFQMVGDVCEIPEKDGLVFASEYFEHFLDPITHLEHIVQHIDPKYFVIANSFNTRSIGHFIDYNVKGVIVPQKKISRIFNNRIRELGYKKVDTGYYNSRPAVWSKCDDNKLPL